jgi:hypothetical protein
MLKEVLDRCTQELLKRPFTLLQGCFIAKGVEPDYRFGYCCEDLARMISDYASSVGNESFILKSKDVNHISSISVEDGRVYIADPGLSFTEAADITDTIGNPDSEVCVDCYSEIPGEKMRIRGIEKGIKLSKNSVDWWSNQATKKTFRMYFSEDSKKGLRDTRVKVVTPLFRVIDFEAEKPRPLSILFTRSSYLVKGYDGHLVYGDTKGIESRILELMGNGLTMQDLRDYTDRCFGMYR